jgi:predicted DNA-binding protein YlxM (UPF0122 family)
VTYPVKVKDKATLLRQRGYSVNEIASEMKIVKSTAFEWTRDIKLSKHAQDVLTKKRRDRGFKPNNTLWAIGKENYRARVWPKEKLATLEKYYHSGLSIREVAQKMNTTLGAVVHTMQRNNIKRRSSIDTLHHQFYKSPLSYNPKQNLSSKEQLLKVAGLMLYWAEGGKRNTQAVNFTNSDPLMIRVFMKFLRSVYQVDKSKLRCHIYCFKNQNIDELTNFWSLLTQIPKTQFQKPYIRKNGGTKHNRMKYGLIHIVYSDTRLIQLILKEIKLLSYNM